MHRMSGRSCLLEVLCLVLLAVNQMSATPVRNIHDTLKDDIQNVDPDKALMDIKNKLDDIDIDLYSGTTEPPNEGGWTVTDTIITCVVLGVFFLIVLPLLCFFCQLYMCCKCCCKVFTCCCCCKDD